MDSSAIVKTIVREPESTALRRYLKRYEVHSSSALAMTEVTRAVRRSEIGALQRADQTLARLVLIDVDQRVLRSAGEVTPGTIRSLDAIHLASAQLLGSDLAAFITYDERMAEAARAGGLPVAAPGRR